MARAFYRGYQSPRTTRLHVMREDGKFPGRSALCGVHGWGVRNSDPIILDPMLAAPPAGLSWCPGCLGKLAERRGVLAGWAADLAAKDSGFVVAGFGTEVVAQDLRSPVGAASSADQPPQLNRHDRGHGGAAVQQEDRPSQETDVREHVGEVGPRFGDDQVLLDVHAANSTAPSTCTSRRDVHKMRA